MRALLLLAFPALLPACEPAKIGTGDDTGVATDTDADTDSDTDTDADTDADTDTTGPVELPPDHVVDCDGAGDFRTIQDAIDAATSGDRIGIEPCTYAEQIDYVGKDLDIYGIGDASDIVIDGSGGTTVTVASAETLGTRLAHVTLTGGQSYDGGAAVDVYYAVLRLDDVDVTGNGRSSATIYGTNGFLTLSDVRVWDNASSDAAVVADAGSLDLDRVDIDCDGASYAVYQHDASLVTDSVLTCGGGYALYSYHGEVNLRRSWLEGAVALYVEDYEGSTDERVYVANSVLFGSSAGAQIYNESIAIENSVLSGSSAALEISGLNPESYVYGSVFVGATCGISGDDTRYDVRWNAFWNTRTDACGVSDTDSVSGDPGFVGYPTDLHLEAASPLVDAGPTGQGYEDEDGSRNDIGVYGGPRPAAF